MKNIEIRITSLYDLKLIPFFYEQKIILSHKKLQYNCIQDMWLNKLSYHVLWKILSVVVFLSIEQGSANDS